MVRIHTADVVRQPVQSLLATACKKVCSRASLQACHGNHERSCQLSPSSQSVAESSKLTCRLLVSRHAFRATLAGSHPQMSKTQPHPCPVALPKHIVFLTCQPAHAGSSLRCCLPCDKSRILVSIRTTNLQATDSCAGCALGWRSVCTSALFQ